MKITRHLNENCRRQKKKTTKRNRSNVKSLHGCRAAWEFVPIKTKQEKKNSNLPHISNNNNRMWCDNQKWCGCWASKMVRFTNYDGFCAIWMNEFRIKVPAGCVSSLIRWICSISFGNIRYHLYALLQLSNNRIKKKFNRILELKFIWFRSVISFLATVVSVYICENGAHWNAPTTTATTKKSKFSLFQKLPKKKRNHVSHNVKSPRIDGKSM